MKHIKYIFSIIIILTLASGISIYIKNKQIKAVIIDNPTFISSVNYSNNGLYIATSSYDGTVKIIDSKTGSLIKLLPYQYNEFGVVDLAIFSPDNACVASVHRKNNIINIWNLKSNRLVTKLVGHRAEITSIAFSPKMNLLATGSRDGMIKVWDLQKNREKFTIQDERIRSLVFSRDGKILLSSSFASTNIKAWDANSGKKIAILEGHNGYISSIQYNQSGTMLISGSVDSTIRFWTADFRQIHPIFEPLHDNVKKVALSPDGKLLVCAYNDRYHPKDRVFICNIKDKYFVYDIKKEMKIQEFQAIDFSPDCKSMVGAIDNKIYIYKLIK